MLLSPCGMARERRALARTGRRQRPPMVPEHQGVNIMTDCGKVRESVRELAARTWDVPAIEGRYRTLRADGMPRPMLDRTVIIAQTREILDRVQRKAEEYEYLGHN